MSGAVGVRPAHKPSGGRRSARRDRPIPAGASAGSGLGWLPVLLLAAISIVAFDRPLVRGDGLAYYMWLRPLAVEHTFDLSGAAAQFAPVNEYQVFRYEPTGRWASAFAFGPAVLLAPFYLAGSGLADPAWVDSAHYLRWQAEPFARSFLVMLGANLLALAAILLAWATARRLGAPPAAAGGAALAAFWGTPLLYYASVEPFMAHVPGAFALSIALWLALRPSPSWPLVGLALSLALLMRWQLALTALPFAALLLWRRDGKSLLALVAGTLALAWLVPLSWWEMYGTLTAVPAAEQNMRPFLTAPVYLPEVVFAANRGWLVWSPVAGLACLGLALLARRRPSIGLPLLAAIALQLVMNASVTEWQAGWSFGMRRMADLYPIYVVGLASLLTLAAGRAQRAAWVATALAVAWSGALFLAHLSYVNAVHGSGGPAFEELRHLLGSRQGPRVALDAVATHYGPWAWPKPGP